ncbi:hypothetical protein SZ64_11210 [Erythrobacter sp. SG61-1L]|nr:hypothetical protein SZ64_11210 [Erythrobacter sp. SG61-1L]
MKFLLHLLQFEDSHSPRSQHSEQASKNVSPTSLQSHLLHFDDIMTFLLQSMGIGNTLRS